MSDDPSPSGDLSQDAEFAELWDQVRKKFATSNMVELKLSSLAQNAETMDWPLDGDDETPSKYIDFSYDELKMLPELAPDPSRIRLLIEILHETLAFDTGFDDMEIGGGSRDQTVERVLNDLQIPADYPIELTNLDEEAKDLCHAEGIESIGQFAEFAQNMAQNVVIGGDFRTLVNALTQSDEEEIANYLPFRPQSKGLHMVEAFGMFIRSLDENQKHALAKKAGMKFSEEEDSKYEPINPNELTRLEDKIHDNLKPVLLWFGDEREKLSQRVQAGEDLQREFLVLKDEKVEKIVLYFVHKIFSDKETRKEASSSSSGGGFFRKWFGGRKKH